MPPDKCVDAGAGPDYARMCALDVQEFGDVAQLVHKLLPNMLEAAVTS
jgi:hypothetical protein